MFFVVSLSKYFYARRQKLRSATEATIFELHDGLQNQTDNIDKNVIYIMINFEQILNFANFAS